jgi:threonine synthase
MSVNQQPSNRFSYATHLVCTKCGKKYAIDEINTYCLDCQAPLFAIYDLKSLRQDFQREDFTRRKSGMWRWHELLPIRSPANAITLGEGDAPLLLLANLGGELGLSNLFVKDESANPTGSFKARGISAAISKAKELGIDKVIIPTAGNAGGAMAAYAARARLKAHIIMPKDTPRANIEESRIAGAEVVLIDGLISEAARMAGIKARAEGWFDLSTFKEPYRVEGKKIMGYELAEAFGWCLPDVIIYPTGGGTGLVGMWKAFAELEDLGWLDNTQRPRMVAVQAEGCAPVVKAFEAHATFCDFWTNARTLASGLRVPKSFADHIILQDIYDSKGIALSVSDEAILAAQSQLGKEEGIFSAPEGAATLAGLISLTQSGWVRPDERIVLFNTGSGLKYINNLPPGRPGPGPAAHQPFCVDRNRTRRRLAIRGAG